MRSGIPVNLAGAITVNPTANITIDLGGTVNTALPLALPANATLTVNGILNIQNSATPNTQTTIVRKPPPPRRHQLLVRQNQSRQHSLILANNGSATDGQNITRRAPATAPPRPTELPSLTRSTASLSPSTTPSSSSLTSAMPTSPAPLTTPISS